MVFFPKNFFQGSSIFFRNFHLSIFTGFHCMILAAIPQKFPAVSLKRHENAVLSMFNREKKIQRSSKDSFRHFVYSFFIGVFPEISHSMLKLVH